MVLPAHGRAGRFVRSHRRVCRDCNTLPTSPATVRIRPVVRDYPGATPFATINRPVGAPPPVAGSTTNNARAGDRERQGRQAGTPGQATGSAKAGDRAATNPATAEPDRLNR
ncbi:hypothetical protein GCM10023322_46630 [Rugosimonospora acidiphila]|uniref:Uncharacterized protein n=1 Tax=Rugosimonospora acidiphila TaxID=556531 RepID=A0ABP9S4F4_9ACTN